MDNENELSNPVSRIIARAWLDEEFKKKLVADPQAVLKMEGIDIPAGITVKILQNDKNTRHLVIPERPQTKSKDLTVKELEILISAGATDAGGNCL